MHREPPSSSSGASTSRQQRNTQKSGALRVLLYSRSGSAAGSQAAYCRIGILVLLYVYSCTDSYRTTLTTWMHSSTASSSAQVAGPGRQKEVKMEATESQEPAGLTRRKS